MVRQQMFEQFEGGSRKQVASAVRHCLVPCCFCELGQIDGLMFSREMRKAFGHAHADDHDLWSSLRLAHQKVVQSLGSFQNLLEESNRSDHVETFNVSV